MSSGEMVFLVLAVFVFVTFSGLLFWTERKTTSKD